jgi:hypothetical protein
MPSVLDLITVAIQQKMIVTAMYQGLVKRMCAHVVVRTSCADCNNNWQRPGQE